MTHPAAHLARGPLEIRFAKAESGENLLGLRLQPVAAEFVEPIMRVVVNVLRVQGLDRMIRLPGLDDPPQLREFRRDGRSQFHHRLVPHGRALLRQVTDGDIAFGHHLAVVRRLLAQDERKERGLARAIRADQPEAVLPVDLQGHVGEQDAPAIGFAYAGNCQHRTGRCSRDEDGTQGHTATEYIALHNSSSRVWSNRAASAALHCAPDLVIRGWVEVDGKPHKGLDRVVNFTGLKLPDTSNAATAVTKTASK